MIVLQSTMTLPDGTKLVIEREVPDVVLASARIGPRAVVAHHLREMGEQLAGEFARCAE